MMLEYVSAALKTNAHVELTMKPQTLSHALTPKIASAGIIAQLTIPLKLV